MSVCRLRSWLNHDDRFDIIRHSLQKLISVIKPAQCCTNFKIQIKYKMVSYRRKLSYNRLHSLKFELFTPLFKSTKTFPRFRKDAVGFVTGIGVLF